MDVRPGFENGDVGVVGEDHNMAGILQFDMNEVPNKELILEQ